MLILVNLFTIIISYRTSRKATMQNIHFPLSLRFSICIFSGKCIFDYSLPMSHIEIQHSLNSI